jgi:hypothetical protein
MELLQYLAFTAVLVSTPGFTQLYRGSPWEVAFALLLLAFGGRVVQSWLWRHGVFDGNGPHIMFWNLIAGWFLFNATLDKGRSGWQRWASLTVIAAMSFLTWGPWLARTWTTIGAAAVLVTVRRISLPFPVATFLTVVSEAALAIYILHMPAIWLFNSLTGSTNTLTSGVFAILACALLWAMWTAMTRAHRILATERPPERRISALWRSKAKTEPLKTVGAHSAAKAS